MSFTSFTVLIMRKRNSIAYQIGGYGMSAYCAAGSLITLTRGLGFTSIAYGAASLVCAAATNELVADHDQPLDLAAAEAAAAPKAQPAAPAAKAEPEPTPAKGKVARPDWDQAVAAQAVA